MKAWPMLLWAAWLPLAAHAVLQDEIQVYTDDINAPGVNGLELHVNTTPNGVTQPSYPGELTSDHGWRVTPEFSHGLSKTTEVGLYLPMTYANDGKFYLAGAKLRFKWLPVQADDSGGFFAGMNFELSQLQRRFSDSARTMEVRNILGWKNSDWLLAVNPIFDLDLSPGFSHSPDFLLSTKIDRRVTDKVWLGWESYDDRGRYVDPLPTDQQNRVNFLVLDYYGEPFDFNFGIGKGATPVSDRWTVKGIIEVPYKF